MVKCSFAWNVQWMETEVEKRMRGKPSVLRKLWPFCPPNLTRHLQLQKNWSEIIDSQSFWISQLPDLFAENRLIFGGFPFFQRKTVHFREEITAYNRKNVRGNINSIGRKRNCKGRKQNSKGQNLEYPHFLEFRCHFPKVKCRVYTFYFPRIKKTRTISPSRF